MSNGAQDWFSQVDAKAAKAPPSAAPAGGDDWFAQVDAKTAKSQTAAPKSQVFMSAQPNPLTKEWWKKQFVRGAYGAAESMPAAGATTGAMIAGTAGLGTGPLDIAATAAGAGVGGMGGESLRQIIRAAIGFPVAKTSGEAASSITKEGLTQAAVQVPSELLPMAAGPLKKAAATQYERALAPTGRYTKAIAKDIVPGLIERGEVGSIKGLEKRATAKAAALTPELKSEYGALEAASPKLPVRGAGGRMQAATAGQLPGAGKQVIKDLESLKAEYMVPDAAGVMHPANPQAINAIEGVQEIVRQYGPNISPTSLRQLRQIFDEPVAHAGGYAGADLATHYTLNAQEAAANSIRKILHSASPDIGGLNKEISFWLDVRKVTSETALRQTGQAGGLVKTFAPLAAATAGGVGLHYGGAAGGVEAATLMTLVALATKMIRSPAWRTTSAIVKDRVANALASGSIGDLAALATRFGIAVQRNDQTGEQPSAQ